MQDDFTIYLRVPGPVKGAWVAASRSRGMKLGDWIVQKVTMSADFDGFTLNVPAFLPFERYILALTDDEARAAFRRARELDAQAMAEDDAVYCGLKITKTYLEKRVAIADGMAHPHLLHDINADALDCYARAPHLTHAHLVAVLTAKP